MVFKLALPLMVLTLQVYLIVGQTTQPSSSCNNECSCTDAEDEGETTFTKQEGLAVAVGAISPIVIGGAGLGLYHLLKGVGSSVSSGMGSGPGDIPTPRPGFDKRPSLPSYKDSPPSYHANRRGSTPVSMFSEGDELTFDDDWGRGGSRPDSGSGAYTNIHSPKPNDNLNRWM